MALEDPTIISIAVGIVNLLALGFVGCQVYITRKALQLTEKNLLESQQTREVSSLPKAYSIISVQNHLRDWKEDLQLLTDNKSQIRKFIKTSNADIKMETQHYSGDTKLISKGEYNTLPDWLKVILITGAQYYYEGMCLMEYVCSSKERRESRLSLLNDMIDRAQFGFNGISEMQKYIDKMIPRWYLESPASLNDSDFLY